MLGLTTCGGDIGELELQHGPGSQPDKKVRVNVAFSKLRPCFSNALGQAIFVIAISTLPSTNALSGFGEGVASYRTGNYEDAFKEWSEAAQAGDVDAQYNLGCLY